MNNFETGSHEQHEVEIIRKPSIRLEIFRHDQPAPAAEGQTDEQRQLTPQVREHAQQVGQGKNPNSSMGLAYGSPRDRAQETAYRQLLANEVFVNAESSFDDIKNEVDKSLAYGKKMIVSEGLNYQVANNPEFGKAWSAAYNKGEVIPFLFEESDRVALENNDLKDYSYSRSAANVARIVKKYVGIEPVWQNVYEKNKEKYQDNTEMQRFVGTHQTIGETFLLKVIEKNEGRGAAGEFINDLPNKNGFDLSQGISVNISNTENGVMVTVKYGDKTWNVKPETLDEIISDAEKLDNDIKAKLAA